MTPALRVIAGGLNTTVQDLGRPGYQHLGVPPSGALDPVGLRAANALALALHELAANAHEYMPMFAVGFFVSFLAAWVCVRWLLRYVATHTFIPFAWYRIAFGIVVLATWMTHMVDWVN